MKDVNVDDTLILSSYGVVLQFYERGKCFYNTKRDIVERTYIYTFHLQYINQSSDFKNWVLQKLQESFYETMVNVICETCNSKNLQ